MCRKPHRKHRFFQRDRCEECSTETDGSQARRTPRARDQTTTRLSAQFPFTDTYSHPDFASFCGFFQSVHRRSRSSCKVEADACPKYSTLRKQALVARSSAEGEHCAGRVAVTEAMRIREVLLLAGFKATPQLPIEWTAAHGVCKREGLRITRHLALDILC